MNQQRLDEVRTLWQQAKDCENIITQGRMDIHLIGMIPELLDEIERLRKALKRRDEKNL